jgi:transcriptional regulator GlxA family with amidase domain
MHNTPHLMHKTLLLPSHLRLTGRVEFRQGLDVEPHHHPILELVYYLEGQIRCRIGEAEVPCRPGMLRLMPPGVLHGERSLTPWACYYILIEAPLAMPWPQLYVDDASGTLGKLCNVLVTEWNGQAPDREAMLGLLLQQIDMLLRRAHTQREETAGERLVRAAEQLFRERFTGPVAVGEVAEALNVSPSYLRAQFVRQRGQTPMAFLQALRVEHAVALIRNSDLSLEAVAKLCGYDSASHLSRNVMRALGRRPGALRQT